MFLTILLVVLGIALVVVFLNREKDEEKARMAIMGLTVAITVVAILSVIGIGRGGSGLPQVDTSVDTRVGQAAGERILRAAEGRAVVLIADTNPYNMFAKARLEGFQQQIAANNKELLGIQTPWPSVEIADVDIPEEGVSAWAIEEAMRNFPGAEVIVSLVGFPSHNFDRVSRNLGSVEFFAIEESFLGDWQPYVQRGVVKGLVAPPYDADWSDTSGGPQELFERRFLFVTRENFSELAHRFADPY